MDLLNPPRLDKSAVKKFFDRAAKSYDHAAILQQEVLKRLIERLHYMRHRPATIIDLGCGTGNSIPDLQKAYPKARVVALDIAPAMLSQARKRFRRWSKKRLVEADMEQLPFADASFDLVFSSLALPWSNDIGATLKELARVSSHDSLLLFASLGPGTLAELEASWRALDSHPHVHGFVDMHDVGDAMMAAGFVQPVVDAETIRMEYAEFGDLFDDLRKSGSSNAHVGRRRGLTAAKQLRLLEESYRQQGFENGKFIVSYEIVYGHAWTRRGAQEPGGTMPWG